MKIVGITILLLYALNINGMDILILQTDSIGNRGLKHPALFYDSLHVKANRHRITKWLYNYMITTPHDTISKDHQSYEYYHTFGKMTIGSVSIKSLDVFGPDFSDTSKTASLWIEKMANKMHSKSNLNIIRKNLWIKVGQELDPDLIMDNERLLRSLPYLKDVRFIIKPRIGNDKIVDILILTKDVFSFGVNGSVSNFKKGEMGVYDKNILGIGHEIGLKFMAHTVQTPHLGMEAYYAINNLGGNFVNFSAGYNNNYIRNDFFVSLQRDFLRPRSVYAGGITALRSFRSNKVNLDDNVISNNTLNYIFLDGWYGRRLNQIIKSKDNRFQVTLAGRIRYTSFYDRPLPEVDNRQFFANSTFYLGSLSFSSRSYIRDYKVYSYGITEDIPKGYLHELVLGYDHNEFGDRWYSHAFLSSGNLFRQKPFYFYSSLGIGSFWRRTGLEQGMLDLKLNFISPLFVVWNAQVRQFIKVNYTLGINRFDIENLFLRDAVGIRGFESNSQKGKQRLTLNVENVFFQKKSILTFRSAFFTFLDIGIIGPASQSIFTRNYFAGIGVGLRIRNENLVFKTLQLRLAFYPNHPNDVNGIGFMLDEVSKSGFYSFQPRGPEPLSFE